MLALATIFSCLILLVITEPYNGYELGNYVGLLVYHDTPHYGYVKFPSDDGSRIIRKSHYREYERPPPGATYYPDGYTSYHHGSSYHSPPPIHGPPPFPPHHHRRPPSNSYGPPPPPFGKPPSYHHGPPHSRHPFHHHPPPPAFSSSENYNYGSWESQDYDDIHSGEKDCKRKHPHPRFPPKQPIFSTSFTAQPSKTPTMTTSQSGGVFPNLRPTPVQTVTSTASGTTISAPNGLISGNVNQGNCHQQSTFFSPTPPSQQPNILVTSPRPALSSQGTDVSSLVSGVFQNAGQQFGQQANPAIPTTSDTGVDSLVSGVFHGLATQSSQAQQINTPTASTTSVDSLLGGVFPSSNTQSNIPQQQNIPNIPATNIDGLVAGVFSPTTASNNQSPQQNIPGISGSNVDNVIAGVFPSLTQDQQNRNPTVVTASSTANGLISGVFQGLPQQGGRIPQSTFPTFPQSTQNNDDSIPVFQPDIPTNQQQNSFDSTGSNINSSQNIPTFQPTVDFTSGGTEATPTAPGINDGTVSDSDDDSPAFDIDIRLGQIGDEVTPTNNQRSGTTTT